MKHRRSLPVLLIVTAVAAGMTLSATQAVATPPTGTVGETITHGIIGERIKITTPRHRDAVVTFQKVTIAPGGRTGWHSHDAEVLAVVASGTVTLLGDDCSARTIPANHGFTENPGQVHEARNLGGVPAVVYVTYVSRPGAALRVDEAAPTCCSKRPGPGASGACPA
jgi:quercetin dioxygenase-like cupin family protein